MISNNIGIILLLIIIFTITIYLLLINYFKKLITKNWSYYKCKWYIVPIAGRFKPEDDPSTPWEFASKNFRKCNWVRAKGFFHYFIKPVQYIIEIIIKIIKQFTEILNTFRAQARRIREIFKVIVQDIAEKLMNSYAAIQFYQAKIENILKQQFAIFQLIMYFAESIKLTLDSLINGPIIDLIKFLPVYGIAMLVMMVICTLCIVGGPFVKMFTCPICLACFSHRTIIPLKNNCHKFIKDIDIGDNLLNEGRVISILKFNVTNRECPMYDINGIKVSGSHIIINKKAERVENLDIKPIEFTEDYIYCLNTTNGKISCKNNLNKIQLFSDFFESYDKNNNLINQQIIERHLNNGVIHTTQDINHTYQWGFSERSQVMMKNGTNKYISEIKCGDETILGGKVYGLIKHSAKHCIIYKYLGISISGTQLIYKNNLWTRIYQVDNLKIDDQHEFIYHIVTENHIFLLKNHSEYILARDYFEEAEDNIIFDKIHSNNLNLRNKNILKNNKL